MLSGREWCKSARDDDRRRTALMFAALKPSRQTTMRLLLRSNLLLLLTLLAVCTEGANQSAKGTLQCHAANNNQDDNESIVCEFTIPKKQQGKLDLEYCQDDYCVKTTVVKEQRVTVTTTTPEEEAPVLPLQDDLRDYQPPYSQYGRNVGRVLARRPKTSPISVHDILKLAEWYADLGKAYRQDAMVNGAIDWNKMNSVEDCQNAFQHAILQYKRALQRQNDKEEVALDTRLSLGAVESFLAESLLFDPNANPDPHRALQHFMAAHENYKLVLETKTLSPQEERAWELNLADVSGHAASVLLQDFDEFNGDAGGTNIDVGRFLESADKADQLLSHAIEIYRKTVDSAVGDDGIFYEMQLANSLHNLGTAKMLTSTVGRAISVMEEARTVFQQVIPKVKGKYIADEQDAIRGMAELLTSLSDAYLQAGHYSQAKTRYKEAMDWFIQHNIVPAEDATLMVRSDDLLIEMEQKLADYHASLVGGGGDAIHIPDDYHVPGEPLYEPDPRYEADLYAAIGSIELSHGEAELAMTHFVKAISMYEDVGGEARAIADVKLNMAMALLRLNRFEESGATHLEALDIYREVVGEGKNPLVVDDLLQQDGGGGEGSDGAEPKSAEDENAFRAQLVNMEALQQGLANMTATDEL